MADEQSPPGSGGLAASNLARFTEAPSGVEEEAFSPLIALSLLELLESVRACSPRVLAKHSIRGRELARSMRLAGWNPLEKYQHVPSRSATDAASV